MTTRTATNSTVGSGTLWTPGIAFGGSATGIIYTTQTGTYVQIGNLVIAWFNILLSNKGAQTGNATITGLPVAIANAAELNAPFSIAAASLTVATGVAVVQCVVNTTTIGVFSDLTGTLTALTNAAFANTTSLQGLVIYHT
jgi:hypothetical protein